MKSPGRRFFVCQKKRSCALPLPLVIFWVLPSHERHYSVVCRFVFVFGRRLIESLAHAAAQLSRSKRNQDWITCRADWIADVDARVRHN